MKRSWTSWPPPSSKSVLSKHAVKLPVPLVKVVARRSLPEPVSTSVTSTLKLTEGFWAPVSSRKVRRPVAQDAPGVFGGRPLVPPGSVTGRYGATPGVGAAWGALADARSEVTLTLGPEGSGCPIAGPAKAGATPTAITATSPTAGRRGMRERALLGGDMTSPAERI